MQAVYRLILSVRILYGGRFRRIVICKNGKRYVAFGVFFVQPGIVLFGNFVHPQDDCRRICPVRFPYLCALIAVAPVRHIRLTEIGKFRVWLRDRFGFQLLYRCADKQFELEFVAAAGIAMLYFAAFGRVLRKPLRMAFAVIVRRNQMLHGMVRSAAKRHLKCRGTRASVIIHAHAACRSRVGTGHARIHHAPGEVGYIFDVEIRQFDRRNRIIRDDVCGIYLEIHQLMQKFIHRIQRSRGILRRAGKNNFFTQRFDNKTAVAEFRLVERDVCRPEYCGIAYRNILAVARDLFVGKLAVAHAFKNRARRLRNKSTELIKCRLLVIIHIVR